MREEPRKVVPLTVPSYVGPAWNTIQRRLHDLSEMI